MLGGYLPVGPGQLHVACGREGAGHRVQVPQLLGAYGELLGSLKLEGRASGSPQGKRAVGTCRLQAAGRMEREVFAIRRSPREVGFALRHQVQDTVGFSPSGDQPLRPQGAGVPVAWLPAPRLRGARPLRCNEQDGGTLEAESRGLVALRSRAWPRSTVLFAVSARRRGGEGNRQRAFSAQDQHPAGHWGVGRLLLDISSWGTCQGYAPGHLPRPRRTEFGLPRLTACEHDDVGSLAGKEVAPAPQGDRAAGARGGQAESVLQLGLSFRFLLFWTIRGVSRRPLAPFQVHRLRIKAGAPIQNQAAAFRAVHGEAAPLLPRAGKLAHQHQWTVRGHPRPPPRAPLHQQLTVSSKHRTALLRGDDQAFAEGLQAGRRQVDRAAGDPLATAGITFHVPGAQRRRCQHIAPPSGRGPVQDNRAAFADGVDGAVAVRPGVRFIGDFHQAFFRHHLQADAAAFLVVDLHLHVVQAVGVSRQVVHIPGENMVDNRPRGPGWIRGLVGVRGARCAAGAIARVVELSIQDNAHLLR